jgi:hypothetical protein
LLGREHADTVLAMSSLAQTLYAQRDLAGARKLQEQVLEARVQLLSEEHPETLAAKEDLAQTLYDQGDLAGAFELQEQVRAALDRLLRKQRLLQLPAMLDLAGARKLAAWDPLLEERLSLRAMYDMVGKLKRRRIRPGQVRLEALYRLNRAPIGGPADSKSQ